MGALADDVFRAIADKTRRNILVSLHSGAQTVTQICAGFDISQPSVSAHLQVLRNVGLVRVEPRANERLYSLDPSPLVEVAQWMDYFRDFWEERLDVFGSVLDARAAKRTKQKARGVRKGGNPRA